MSYEIIIMCLLATLSWNIEGAVDIKSTDIASITFNITSEYDSISCGLSSKEPATVTVLQDRPLKLDVSFRRDIINLFMCETLNNHYLIFKSSEAPTVPKIVHEVKNGILNIWNCTILTHKNIGGIKRIVSYDVGHGMNTYAAAYCYLKVHVRLARTPQVVLVNNMVLPTTQSPLTDPTFDHTAVYYYSIGDFVNVSCITPFYDHEPTTTKTIKVSYDYADNLNLNFTNVLNEPNKYGYGFRAKLRAEHNNSAMVCTFNDTNDFTRIKVTFVQKQFHDKVELKVNGHLNRRIEDTDFNYMFVANESVHIECLKDDQQYGSTTDSMPYEVISPNVSYCPVQEKNKVKNFKFNITELPKDFKDHIPLSMDLSKHNTLVELYDYNHLFDHHSWIYYEFYEGDIVILECSTTTEISTEIEYTLDDKAYNGTNGIKKLTSDDDKSIFKCILKDEKPPSKSTEIRVYKQISVQFLWRERTTTTTVHMITETETTSMKPSVYSPLKDDTLSWIIPVVAILMCIVLVSVIVVIYRMRKKNNSRDTDTNGILQSPSESSIPPYPRQWNATEEQNYHVPIDLKKDNNIYAVPVNNQEDPYAIPIPKNKRKPKTNPGEDTTYAELNFPANKPGKQPAYVELDRPFDSPKYSSDQPTYAEVKPSGNKSKYCNNDEPTYAAVMDLYSKVPPKSDRKNNQDLNASLYAEILAKTAKKNNNTQYGNVFPDSRYVNSEGAEYVEPTYIEAHRK